MSDTTSTPSVSTTETITSTSQQPTRTSDRGGSGFPGGASSSLYLFTFLATLLLLLAVSCAIVMRSFVLRRRFRRRVEEALAAGIILPQHPPRKRDFGEKPRLWDAWLTPTDTKWSSIMPVSAKILSEGYTGAGRVKKSGKSATNEIAPSALSRTRRVLNGISNYIRPRQPERTPPSPGHTNNTNEDVTPPAFATPGETRVKDAKLQVSVLIAMPSPYRPFANEFTIKGKERGYDVDGDEEVPDVVFGVTELPWKVRSLNDS